MARAYANTLEYYLREFEKQETGALYSFQYYMEHDSRWSEEYESSYSSLQKCREILRETLDGDKPLSYCIKKHWIDYIKPDITVTFNGDGEVDDIDYPWNDKTANCIRGSMSVRSGY